MTYGACFGDAAGAPYEYNGCKNGLDDLMTSTIDGTDDTIMTVAVAATLNAYSHLMDRSVIYNREWQEEFKKRLVQNMVDLGRSHLDAGYGGAFLGWLIGDDHSNYGSWGNGSAMRVSPVGWFGQDKSEVMAIAKMTAEVSHGCLEGIRGAQAIALGVFLARTGHSKIEIRDGINWAINVGYHAVKDKNASDTNALWYDLDRTTEDIIWNGYSFDVSCQQSVPEAICAFLDPASIDYESTVRNAIILNGDADTQAAMAGGIAEAFYGTLPNHILLNEKERLEKLGLLTIMDVFYDNFVR